MVCDYISIKQLPLEKERASEGQRVLCFVFDIFIPAIH